MCARPSRLSPMRSRLRRNASRLWRRHSRLWKRRARGRGADRWRSGRPMHARFARHLPEPHAPIAPATCSRREKSPQYGGFRRFWGLSACPCLQSPRSDAGAASRAVLLFLSVGQSAGGNASAKALQMAYGARCCAKGYRYSSCDNMRPCGGSDALIMGTKKAASAAASVWRLLDPRGGGSLARRGKRKAPIAGASAICSVRISYRAARTAQESG